MLAYSSIAHAGYLLVGVLAASAAGAREKALSGILFYLVSYTASAIGAFAVVGALERKARKDDEPGAAWDLDRFAGLAQAPPGARLRDGGLPALARGRAAHRGLHREALRLPGRGRRGARTASRSSAC